MGDPEKSRLRVLFVCALNQWRSPTAEALYRNDARLEVRSAGLSANAARPLSDADIEWAEIIFVMDREQKEWLQETFRSLDIPRIHSLDIPDTLVYMDLELQRRMRQGIDPEIDALLGGRSP
ncbi:MAG TPA: protein tyrosine phosphatase [Opitutus sp.]|nr:protein tyrosine phosphatase [Opitutus sp.]